MACACVTLGNAPTRMVLTGHSAQTETMVATQSTNPIKCLFPLLASDDHGKEGRILLGTFLALTIPANPRAVVRDQVGQGGVVEDAGGRIANVEEDLIEGTVGKVAVDQFTQLFGVAERRERAVNQAHDLA